MSKNTFNQINLRLKTLYDMIPECARMGDVGTDHGYLPIYLVEKEICPKAICADIAKGPLKSAEKNIEDANLADKISLRLGNGLMVLAEGEADCVTICGMGASLMG